MDIRQVVNAEKMALPAWAKFLDYIMLPVMYLVSGTFRESPQRTHFWNNLKLGQGRFRKFFRRSADNQRLVLVDGVGTVGKRWWGIIPIFHIPILGGWRNYVVLKPSNSRVGDCWYLGWYTVDGYLGISKIPLKSHEAARALRGGKPTHFFALDSEFEIVPLGIVGYGRIGDGNKEYRHLPLL